MKHNTNREYHKNRSIFLQIYTSNYIDLGDCCGRDHMVDGLDLPVQSVPITTQVVSLNPVHGEVYSMQHYVIKFISDLRQVGDFLWVLWFPPSIKNIVEIGVKHHNPNPMLTKDIPDINLNTDCFQSCL